MLKWNTVKGYNDKLEYEWQNNDTLPELDKQYLIYFTNDFKPNRRPFVGAFYKADNHHIYCCNFIDGGEMFEIQDGIKWANFNMPIGIDDGAMICNQIARLIERYDSYIDNEKNNKLDEYGRGMFNELYTVLNDLRDILDVEEYKKILWW